MWSADAQQLSGGNSLQVTISHRSSPMTLDDVIHGWIQNEEFRSFFIDLLAKTPFADFRWETPASTKSSTATPFEFVVVNSPGLAEEPDPSAFADHFHKSNKNADVISFCNLSRDALLIVPRPIAQPEVYRHIGVFHREAPEEQKHLLWQIVASEMVRTLGTAPIWLNTAGAGVSWLHVRIDQKPKYYVHTPYRRY